MNLLDKPGHLPRRKILHNSHRCVAALVVVTVEFFLVENQRLGKTQTDLHGQVAHDLVAGLLFQFKLRRTAKDAPVFKAHVVGVKQGAQLVDVHVHVEP